VTVFWRALPGGVSVAVKVQPGARHTGVHGTAPSADGPRLRIAVTEPPQGGRATRAACDALAAALDVPPSAVRILAGAATREKRLFVGGDTAALGRRLDTL